jgi:hypothetical protein
MAWLPRFSGEIAWCIVLRNSLLSILKFLFLYLLPSGRLEFWSGRVAGPLGPSSPYIICSMKVIMALGTV